MKSAQLSSLAPNSEVWLKRRARNPSAASDVSEAMRPPRKIRGWPCHREQNWNQQKPNNAQQVRQVEHGNKVRRTIPNSKRQISHTKPNIRLQSHFSDHAGSWWVEIELSTEQEQCSFMTAVGRGGRGNLTLDWALSPPTL